MSTQVAQSLIRGNYLDANGFTPLDMVTGKGHAAMTKQLIAARCNVNLQTKKGDTPMHLAAVRGQKGHETVTKQLIAARC